MIGYCDRQHNGSQFKVSIQDTTLLNETQNNVIQHNALNIMTLMIMSYTIMAPSGVTPSIMLLSRMTVYDRWHNDTQLKGI